MIILFVGGTDKMPQRKDSRGKKTFYVSYVLYDSPDMWLYPEIRFFCETRFKAKFLKEDYFVCSTHLSADRIAQEVFNKMREESGMEGQVVVIDSTQVAFSGYAQREEEDE